jgi:hypothetical protein
MKWTHAERGSVHRIFSAICIGTLQARIRTTRLTNGSRAVKVDAGRPLRRTAFLLSPIGWEVMQLVAWQTLTLLILVRVQASQPNFS